MPVCAVEASNHGLRASETPTAVDPESRFPIRDFEMFFKITTDLQHKIHGPIDPLKDPSSCRMYFVTWRSQRLQVTALPLPSNST